MKRLFALLLSLLLLLCACGGGEAPAETTTQPTEAATQPTETTPEVTEAAPLTVTGELKEQMDAALEEMGFVGIVSLTHHGTVVYQSVTGNDELGQPLTADSSMYVGSVSKQFCAAAIVKLRDQGKLSLDDTLDLYFPEYPLGKDLTVRNLLTMSSGMRTVITASDGIAFSAELSDQENLDLAVQWLFQQPLHFEPGSEMEYCNFNYTLLGLIVEQLSGQSYQEFITENFFKPLGMTHSGFVSQVKENPEWAKGLTYDTMQETDLIGLPQGAGDIVTNAADIELWMTALRTGQVVSMESYREMTTPAFNQVGRMYGYGLFAGSDSYAYHGGNIGGYTAFDGMDSAYDCNIFLANNQAHPRLEALAGKLLKLFREAVETSVS